MRHISPYYSQPETIALISSYFSKNEDFFAKKITCENIKWEANMLNISEAVLSEKQIFDLHFDMIVNQGAKAVTKY